MKNALKILLLLAFAPWILPAACAAVTCDVSADGVAFGSYDSIGIQTRDTSGTIFVTCQGTIGDNVSYSIQLNTGGGSYGDRLLNAGATSLSYNLYTDVGRTQVWGDGSNDTSTVSDGYTLSQTSTTRQYTVYGRIPAGQNQAAAGGYLDSVVVSLNY